MTDDTKPSLITPASDSGHVSAPDVFVRGDRTRPEAHERNEHLLREDERKRREDYDAEVAAAKNIPAGEGMGNVYGGEITENPELPKASVLLTFLRPSGEIAYERGRPIICMSNVWVIGEMPDGMPEYAFDLICPRCIQQGTAESRCTRVVRQSQKSFHLSSKGRGQVEVFQGFDLHGEFSPAITFLSAGEITSERFKCDLCGWTARVDKNRVWPDL